MRSFIRFELSLSTSFLRAIVLIKLLLVSSTFMLMAEQPSRSVKFESLAGSCISGGDLFRRGG